MTRASRTVSARRGLLVAASLITLTAASLPAVGGVAAAEPLADGKAASFAASDEDTSSLSAADYTGSSWAAFVAARAKSKSAADGLVVMVCGLRTLVGDYQTRVPARYTADSWAPFAKALTTAHGVVGDASATRQEVAAAKSALVSAAAELEAADEGTFQTITNDTFWRDTSGNPIYSQGGGVFKFGDTYYWYGVHDPGRRVVPGQSHEELRRPGHLRLDPGVLLEGSGELEVRAECRHHLHDPAQWHQARRWVGRLGVAYNENTGKYVLVVQGPGGVVFLRGDSPTDTFDGAAVQGQITNVVHTGYRRPDALHRRQRTGLSGLPERARGRGNSYVAKLRDSDSLFVETRSAGRLRRLPGPRGQRHVQARRQVLHPARPTCTAGTPR